MASIIYNDKTYALQKGADVLGQLLNQGAEVQYICMSGSCGTCKVKVVAGAEHLTTLAGMLFVRALAISLSLSSGAWARVPRVEFSTCGSCSSPVLG